MLFDITTSNVPSGPGGAAFASHLRHADARLEPRPCHVARRQGEHVVGEVDGIDLDGPVATAKLDGDERRARPDVERATGSGRIEPGRGEGSQQVLAEARVDLAVVHRVVVAGLFLGVHDLGLEDSGQRHGARSAIDPPVAARPAGSDTLLPMKRARLRHHLRALLLVPALGLVAPAALAEEGKKKHDGDESSAPAGGGAKYREACKDGNTKYAARDFVAAIAAYQKAIELDPNNALGHYFLGEAQLAAGNLIEAEAAWNRASLAATDKEAALRARVLFVLADLKERQKKWDDAKAAWQVYIDWATKYPNAGAFPGSGQSRQQAIDNMKKQDAAVAVVRARIAETKAGGVFTDLSKPSPSK